MKTVMLLHFNKMLSNFDDISYASWDDGTDDDRT